MPKRKPKFTTLEGKVTALEFDCDDLPPAFDRKFAELFHVLGIADPEDLHRFKTPADRFQVRVRFDNATVVLEIRVEGFTGVDPLDELVLSVAREKELDGHAG